MSLGNPVPRSLVIRWPPARDPHWLGVQTAPGVLKPGAKAKVHMVHYEPGGRFELRPSGCQWGGGGNDSLNHRSCLYILFTPAARFWQALLPPLSQALMPLTGVTLGGDGMDRGSTRIPALPGIRLI